MKTIIVLVMFAALAAFFIIPTVNTSSDVAVNVNAHLAQIQEMTK